MVICAHASFEIKGRWCIQFVLFTQYLKFIYGKELFLYITISEHFHNKKIYTDQGVLFCCHLVWVCFLYELLSDGQAVQDASFCYFPQVSCY